MRYGDEQAQNNFRRWHLASGCSKLKTHSARVTFGPRFRWRPRDTEQRENTCHSRNRACRKCAASYCGCACLTKQFFVSQLAVRDVVNHADRLAVCIQNYKLPVSFNKTTNLAHQIVHEFLVKNNRYNKYKLNVSFGRRHINKEHLVRGPLTTSYMRFAS